MEKIDRYWWKRSVDDEDRAQIVIVHLVFFGMLRVKI